MGSWSARERRLKRVGRERPPDADPAAPGQPAYNPPIERWTVQLLAYDPGPALCGDEDAYRRWVRMLRRFLGFQLNRKLVEARGERVPLEWAVGAGPPPLPEEYRLRMAEAAAPILERRLQEFEAARPQRLAKQRMRTRPAPLALVPDHTEGG